MRYSVLIAAAGFICLPACSDSTAATTADNGSSAAASADFSGTWTGSIVTTTTGTKTTTETVGTDLVLQQSGTKMTGSVSAFSGTAFDLSRGTIAGSSVPFSGTLKITSTPPSKCTPATLNITLTFDATANTMSGTASGTNEDCLAETDVLTYKKK